MPIVRKSRKQFRREEFLSAFNQLSIGDPFTLIYVRLWQMLEANDDFSSIVPEHNRIKFFNNRKPVKDRKIDSDFPEVMIEASTVDVSYHETSSSAKVVRQLSILIHTGESRLEHLLFPLEWAMIRAVTAWKTEISELTWNGSKFVNAVRFVNPSNSFYEAEFNLLGWFAAWTIEVDMMMPHGSIS